MISSLSQSAVTGIQRGLQQATDAASNIATADRTIDVADLATNIVDLKLAQQQVEASAMAVKVDDQLRGSLLDIRV
jgi:Flp pilus assembly protein TadG